MPKKSAVEPDEAVEILIRHEDLLNQAKLPLSGGDVWKTLSEECGGKWSAFSWWVNVTKNRNQILSRAREKIEIEVLPDKGPEEPSFNKTDFDTTRNNRHSDESDSELEDKEVFFQLVLSSDDWNKIKPVVTTTKKTTHTLRPNVWTNVIAKRFWEEYRIPCAFVFKRADVYSSVNRKCFVRIEGHCVDKKCGNRFRAEAVNEPCTITGTLTLTVRTRDTYFEDHAPVKRPLNGALRVEVGKAALAQGCYNTRNRMIDENTKRGETVGPNVPSGDVVRHAKHDFVQQELNLPKKGINPVHVLEELQYQKEYFGTILHLASNPFVVIYATHEQICTYQQYCRVNRSTSVISIDSTGSVVRKLDRPMGLKSAHIFLYSIVINFEHTILSVFQMLSESQEWEIIGVMLGAFLRRVKIKPKRSISDKSRALLLAQSIMFNGYSISKYIEIIFCAVEMNSLTSKTVDTFLYLDVAHFIHAACKWRCFQNLSHLDNKEFYLACLGLMVDCQTLADFKRIFFLTCVAAGQKYFDSEIDSPYASTVRDNIKILEKLIKTRPVDENGYFKFEEMQKLDDFDVDLISSEDSDCPRIKNFIDNIILKARSVISEGTSKSGCHLPAFLGDLRRVGMEFVLWTAVANPFYMGHQSSSSCEGNFKIIKKYVFKEYSLPQRADRFIVIDIKSSIGRTRDFESNLKTFMTQKKFVPEPLTKEFNNKRKIRIVQDTSGTGPKKAKEDNTEDETDGKLEVFTLDDFDNLKLNARDVIVEDVTSENDFKSREDWRGKAARFYFSAASDVKRKEPKVSEISNVKKCGIKKEKTKIKLEKESEVQEKCEKKRFQDGNNDLLNDSEINITLLSTDTPLFTSSEIEETKSDTHIRDVGTVIESRTLNTGDEQCKHESTTKDSHNVLIDHDYSHISPPKEPWPHKRYNGKSFRPRPEPVIGNFPARRRNGTVHLLQNGNRVSCPIPIIDRIPYVVRNTCPFDSLIQILYTCALDDETYYSFLRKSVSPLSKFVLNFLNKGECRSIYEDRAKLLRLLFSVKNTNSMNHQIVYTINAWGNPIQFWNRLMNSDPSIFKQGYCDICGVTKREFRTWTLDIAITNKFGYQKAQSALKYYPKLYNVKCICEELIYQEYNSNEHVLLELDVRATLTSIAKTCKLRELPSTLMFNVEYRLAGIIAHDSGHFKAYCRRLSGHWELHDGNKDKVERVRGDPIITPECAIYVIKNC